MNRKNNPNSKKTILKKFMLLICLTTAFLATGCIQEKLADRTLPAGSPKQFERWLCTVRAPVGNWKYRVALNPKMYNNVWTGKEWTVASSKDPLLPVTSVTVDPTFTTPPATGEVSIYGMKTFRFYSDNSEAKKLLDSTEKLWYSSLMFEPFNYHMGKDFFTNQMVVRFFLNKTAYESEYGPITNAAVAGDFNLWGKSGERNKNEFKDDGVWPDSTANDGLWTVEVPVESTYTYEYKFYLNPQWDAAAGQWQDGSFKAVPDMANGKNKFDDLTGNSIITIN